MNELKKISIDILVSGVKSVTFTAGIGFIAKEILKRVEVNK